MVPLFLRSIISLPKRFVRKFVAEDLRYLLQRCEVRGQFNPANINVANLGHIKMAAYSGIAWQQKIKKKCVCYKV